MDQVAGNEYAMCAPVACRVVIEYALERVGRRDAAQFAVQTGEQVWIRQVQDPYRVIRRLNRRIP